MVAHRLRSSISENARLGRAALELLNERQIELVLDALEEGHRVALDARDRAALETFVKHVRYDLVPTPAATQAEMAFGFGRHQIRN